ncbi:Positive regulator of purine utilization [Cyphellophora attinorum]|uniref:Positive regulator of purine utilization n=1 Tax=Cyphellophora attinorum TaxID=1664694 RepID=A0A0N0NMG6_9EURO|nr:Positive regulator of purine utilization [Phialophora attinorum]KPI40441.1 Positive regulator of purine utilization [Phialophora attinorum]
MSDHMNKNMYEVRRAAIKGGGSACQRCRRRKQKCDQKYPQCSNCASAGAECLTYHSGKQANIPRDYVTNLEDEIAQLTKEVEQLRQQNHRSPVTVGTAESGVTTANDTNNLSAGPRPESDESSPVLQHLVASAQDVVVQPGNQSRYLGHSSGIAFAKMVMATIHVDRNPVPTSQQQLFQDAPTGLTTPASLPPRSAADHLVEVYFQYRTPHLPILSRTQVIDAIDSAYASQDGGRAVATAAEMNMFVTYMVFAIALVDVPYLSGRSSQSDGCFRSALLWVERLLTYSKSELQTLRVVLLLTQFVALSPAQGSLWHLTGFALRLCIDIGLHWETDTQASNVDAQLLDDRRRLWHSTYHFDRLMSVTLGRPPGILDESIRVQLPNPWINSRDDLSQSEANDYDIYTQRAHNHLFKLAQLESEIIHVQHSQTWSFKLAHPRPNWNAWLQDVKPRLQEWYATIPEPSKAHPQSIFAFKSHWQVLYNNTILLLSRPNLTLSFQAADQLLSSFDAATRVIDGLKDLQREGRVEMLWKSVHHLFMAGLVVIYGLWRSKEIRDQIPVGKSINTLQTCTATLSAMAETFKGASGCRNAFESLSSTTIDWLVEKDIEEIPNNRLEFESQVREVMGHLRSTFDDRNSGMGQIDTEYTSAFAAGENFDLSELLNAAAQWPDLGELDFVMGGQGGEVVAAL